jgi:hypothetical protein
MISSLENTILRAAKTSGAKVRAEHRGITASFDENTIGLALDILLVLEAVLGALQKAETDLYGYSCILGRDIAEDGAALIRHLSREGTGIWCSEALRQLLDPYAVFDPPLDGELSTYRQLRELKPFTRPGSAKDFPCREKIRAALDQNTARSLLLIGPDFIGKREALFRFSLGLLGEFPP